MRSEKLNLPEQPMLVLPTTHHRLQSSVRFSNSANVRFKFDMDVIHDELGLRLVRIGEESPLRVLAAIEPAIEPMLVGVAEVGDSIVAINIFLFARLNICLIPKQVLMTANKPWECGP